jgi:hypothetical protein
MNDRSNIEQKTSSVAVSLAESYDDEALYALIGRQEKVIEADPAAANDPTLNPTYEGTMMGPVDDLKAIGRRIVLRWSRSLHDVVCGGANAPADAEARKKLFDALNVGEAAAIAAVTSLLLPLVSPAIAAPLAVLIVRKFLIPATEEVCDYWGEQLDA